MEETLNSTIDPACLQEPPLAMDVIKQLDVLGLCLYSMLTLMSCISLLLYLEQCAYLYRKLPNPKKTTLMWISGAAPVISTMACFGMWIPRAVMFTDMTSNCYFAVVVYKVVVLIVQEFGGTGAFLKRFSGKPFKVSTGPCCCCCLCLPRVPMSRRWFFFLKLGVLQYAILKTVLSILCIVLWTNGNFDLSDLEITGTAIWINPFIGVLTIISLWPVAIIFMNTNSFLRDIKIVPKYALYQYNVQSAMADKGASESLVETRPLLILVLSQLQTSIINILALDGTIACAPPFSSQARGSMLSQQMMIMEMFIITLINQSLYRRTYDKLPSEVHDNENNAEVALQAAHVEHDV